MLLLCALVSLAGTANPEEKQAAGSHLLLAHFFISPSQVFKSQNSLLLAHLCLPLYVRPLVLFFCLDRWQVGNLIRP